MNYPSMRIEGAILSPDIVDRLDEGSPGQRPSDFGLNAGTKVKDEIARAWADAQDYWRIFQRKIEAVKADTPATSETRQNWITPLLGLLRYDIEFQKAGTEIHGKIYAISHRVINRANTPLHIVGYNDPAGLDRKPANATLRMSAHALVQQYLNLADELNGIVTNGRVIRLLRDSSRLVKQSYLEFDLDRIFNDGLFADFAVLFRLLHATRLPATGAEPKDSLLEKYHEDSLDSGARIRDGLSKAVEMAILDFGNGFLANSANDRLRNEIAEGGLSASVYYRNLLRLIYRLLFLMVIEERDLVFPADTPKAKREIYTQYYSLARLRRMAEKRYLADKRHHDLWMALVSTFRLFEADGPGEKLGINPLAGDLFSPRAIEEIFDASLGNDVLLNCLKSLGLYEHPDTRQLIRVNYGALNVEEFGSVYEGLLEKEPVFDLSESVPRFVFIQGDERSRTGSHYTPDELVQPLIKHSLDYLIEDACRRPHVSKGETSDTGDSRTAEQRLLDLRVADIACGSGHILLAAARRIATELAVVRTGEEQPSPTAYRKALRDVIRNCIYGVDVNPLAVELCKVALWLEAHNPGEPLNFLDHHIKCGNAIVGFVSREEVDNGVPDEAFARMPDDAAEFIKAVRKKNKDERRERQRVLNFTDERRGEIEHVLERWRAITAMPESSPAEIDAKKAAFENFSTSGAAYELEKLASVPIAQFFIPKVPENTEKLMTDAEFRDYWSGERRPQSQSYAAAEAVAIEKRFFHWFLEFPGVMERGGFDCILGNPPYLGGQALSGTYGHPFGHFVKWQYKPTGLSELVVYFLRRIFSVIKPSGFTAFITTNSITDGDVRADGLERVIEQGGTINMAVRSIRWPGRANVFVSLLAIHKGAWKRVRSLDGIDVPNINSFFEDSDEIGEPNELPENEDKVFQGSIFLGDGFLLSHDEADGLIRQSPQNAEVIFRTINGQQLNNEPDQQPIRSIINFHDWTIDRARSYEEPFAIVEEKVRPFRATQNRARNRDVWWIYAEHRPGLNRQLRDIDRCFIAAATSKYLNFSAVSTDIVFSHALFVFTTDRWDLYTVVQSSVHEVWARKYSGALKQDLRYSPSNCFETFAFPGDIWNDEIRELAEIGERYHEHRRQLMLMLWLGLTKIYNLFHDPELSVEIVQETSGKDEDIAREGYDGLLELRRLHVEMDNAVRDAYGWHDLELGHDFHEVETLPENDRTRYTISPAARKEALKRLLALNHERATEEAAKRTAEKGTKKKRGKKTLHPEPDNPLLAAGPLFE
ncbi:MAG: restriction endonuclease [Acidobacteria bacterium]|nr:restriction endonuclease [Acidobacteriota bacterium]